MWLTLFCSLKNTKEKKPKSNQGPAKRITTILQRSISKSTLRSAEFREPIQSFQVAAEKFSNIPAAPATPIDPNMKSIENEENQGQNNNISIGQGLNIE